MAKYPFEATYVREGIKGPMREGGTARHEGLVDALKSRAEPWKVSTMPLVRPICSASSKFRARPMPRRCPQ